MDSYLKTYFIWSLLGISFDGVCGGDCGRVDGAVVGDDEPVTPVVQLQPVEDGPARDHGAGQPRETHQVVGEQRAHGILKQRIKRPNINVRQTFSGKSERAKKDEKLFDSKL